jgi:hypothetical protein
MFPARRPTTAVRIVRELPLVLELVTRDPFIDDPGDARPIGVIASQRDRVRESLLRVEEHA